MKSSVRFKETADGQIKPMGVFMCDGQTVSRSIIDKKNSNETLTKSLQCGYCGNAIQRGEYVCFKCDHKRQLKCRVATSELQYRSELDARLWQANIPPSKDSYPVVGIPNTSGIVGVPGSASASISTQLMNSASNSVSTISGHYTLTSPKCKPNMHTNPEW